MLKILHQLGAAVPDLAFVGLFGFCLLGRSAKNLRDCPRLIPDDGSKGTGSRFYSPSVMMEEVVKRLLMFGITDEAKCDIPSGFVQGFDRSGREGLQDVGQNFRFNRMPRSLFLRREE